MIIEDLNSNINNLLDRDFEQVNLGLIPDIKEITHLGRKCNKSAVFRGAILNGNINNARLIAKILGPPGKEEYCFAARIDNIEMANYALGEHWDSAIIYTAVKYDSSNVFRWVIDGTKKISEKITDSIYKYDSVKCFMYLREQYGFASDLGGISDALMNGRRKIIRYLFDEIRNDSKKMAMFEENHRITFKD